MIDNSQTMPIETLQQIAHVARCHQQGNYGDTFTRFSYMEGGARDFVLFTQNPNYHGYSIELELIRRIFSNAQNLPDEIARIQNILDLGPGNGEKANRIMQMLPKVNSYTAIDISAEMLRIARATHCKIKKTERHYEQFDFKSPSKIGKFLQGRDNLILLLGNTITNEPSVLQYLRDLREAIGRSDKVGEHGCASKTYLLLGVEVFDGCNVEALENGYDTNENRKLTFSPLKMLGANEDDGELRISFCGDSRRIEEVFSCTRHRVIETQIGKISLHPGNKFLLSITGKPTFSQLMESIQLSGWEIIGLEEENNQIVLLLS